MKQLPCIKQYVLAYKRLKTIIPMTNNLTDMIFDDNFYLDPRAFLDEYFCFFPYIHRPPCQVWGLVIRGQSVGYSSRFALPIYN